MLEKLAGPMVLAGLILSVAGSVMEREEIKITGTLVLLIIATVAGYRFLKFHAMNPTREFIGTCIEQKKFPVHYILTFRTGSAGVYSGRAGLQLGEKVKMGETFRIKVKGNIILEIDRLTKK
ncbi:MAG: hypothetical protein K6T29_03345 [Peptococcaceae bacterium]|nr:hypothetical protein [Peptococcaceae bacterium]